MNSLDAELQHLEQEEHFYLATLLNRDPTPKELSEFRASISLLGKVLYRNAVNKKGSHGSQK